MVGADLAAYSIGLLDGRSWRLWDTRINPNYRSLAPGRVLITEVMERLQAEGCWDEFDYMRGEEDYKIRLSDDAVPAEHLRAWSSAGLREARARLPRRAIEAATRPLKPVREDAMVASARSSSNGSDGEPSSASCLGPWSTR